MLAVATTMVEVGGDNDNNDHGDGSDCGGNCDNDIDGGGENV